MKNILKNNGLRQLIVLFAIIFVGNVLSMRMTPQEMERAKIATRKMTKQIQEQQQPQLQQEREKQYQPGKHFVFEKGSSKGVLIDQALLENNSGMVRIMIEDLGIRPQEIVVPFSIETIRLLFDVLNKKVALKNLSQEQIDMLMNIEGYLLFPKTTGAHGKAMETFSLEQLVDAFNETSNLDSDARKVIFEKIVDITNNIANQVLVEWDAIKGIQSSYDYFQNYKGKMIQLLPTSRSLLIPDYKVLNKIKKADEDALQQYKQLFSFNPWEFVFAPFVQGIKSTKIRKATIERHFKEDRLVDFLDTIVKQTQEYYTQSYNALPFYKKALRGFDL